jgi:TRAP transporter TAXI family solute receptor
MHIAKGSTLVVVTLAALAFAQALAAPASLPATLAWSAYDVGSAGYNQAVAIGNALKHEYKVSLRVLPGKNDVSRALPLREGKVQFSATGVGGSYLAQEGVFEFGGKQWGPQAVRLLMVNVSDAMVTLVVAKDTGVRTVADLRGKRIAWVLGAPSLNLGVTAILAFGNLGWSDVRRVEFGGFGAAMDGIVNNQVDAALAISTSGYAYQLTKSPRGLTYPVLPRADKAGWARLQSIAPYLGPVLGTDGAELSKDRPIEGARSPYPVLVSYAGQSTDLVYSMTRAMVETFDRYRSAAPGNEGWDVKRQEFAWLVPYHEGAIRYWKEIGVWKPEHQAHNDRLVERQTVLARAWEQTRKAAYSDGQAFAQAWMKARAEALTKSGFEPVFRSW